MLPIQHSLICLHLKLIFQKTLQIFFPYNPFQAQVLDDISAALVYHNKKGLLKRSMIKIKVCRWEHICFNFLQIFSKLSSLLHEVKLKFNFILVIGEERFSKNIESISFWNPPNYENSVSTFFQKTKIFEFIFGTLYEKAKWV